MKVKHQVCLTLSIALFLFFTLLSLDIPGIDVPGPTGGVIVNKYLSPEASEQTRAYTLHHRALDFFDLDGVVFPEGVCIPAAHELYGNVAYVPVDVSAGFSTSGQERTETMSFVIDRHERFGTIDFVKSPTFLSELNADSLISISSEAIVRVPKAERTTYLVMDLYGETVGPFIYITKGRFSTPTTDCIFLVEGGYALCDCDIHTIKGISVAGITAPSPTETRYEVLVEQTRERLANLPIDQEHTMEKDIAISKVNGYHYQ